MKKLIIALALTTSVPSHTLACSDVFINKGGYHIEARTLDFLVNLAFQEKLGFIGAENTTDVVLDADKIPASQLATWTNEYGYVGRAAFNGEKIIDGMNTEGLSVAILYLPGTIYPAYDEADKKPVLAIYDVAAFLLSQTKKVSEALDLIRSHQLVQSAVREKEGIFIKDLPIHFVIRDKNGESAVIEFIDGQTIIYEKAGDVMTNAPSFDWQLKNATYYDSLRADNKTPNKKFDAKFQNYKEIYKSSSYKGEANLMGMPGDFTPPSRFARGQVLLNNFPTPDSRQVALYQATALNDSLSVPVLKGAAPTLWSTIKDLDDRVYYVKNIVLFQGDRSLYPMPITSSYTPIDLKELNFKVPGATFLQMKIQPTNKNDVKKIISAEHITMQELQ
ncbi:MAG: linear amide C-N hydrolase [Alphaproteobacteria bacterium]|nr:linear amide C-N hydrolase [Alphaproteobacteria bacterium]